MVQDSFLLRLTSSLTLVVVILIGVLTPFRSADAYFITSPVANDFWYFGSKKVLRWSSVSTDPVRFSVAITNHDPSTYPSALSTLVAKGIRKKWGKYELPASALKGLKEGRGYQINIMSLEGGAILAQSPIFTISRVDDESGEDEEDDDEDEVIDYADQQEEVPTTGTDQPHDAHKANKGKDDKDRYKRLGKLHQKIHRHKKAKSYRSRKEFQLAKSKSNALYKSIPKFDHSRSACSRSPRNPKIAKIV
ncbi:hypothetical protein PGT21_037117 [Puccinia graminis f. sp. tritici]|uniref:Yeast cell wall synthesis Kre9/Knh1-like N-terminal domain-containing protein n=2 Tax=Puccinia graminis f. sp. tritici TaxID=56615 RepID=E3L2T3_PUCGT|nr:uncharacterized protein PGTG_17048 [Puccinia graminis f. sp. tritici CRL 75-36-700-3]EFP90849.2 hypothetical protein PGTG_17048 [Puccinia graminis f. sp. tritici CRL 75-36-700-3]KAA1115584.1 hypothetical protein PGT21_037117 [Puccinia graminis f. sp. tritici]